MKIFLLNKKISELCRGSLGSRFVSPPTLRHGTSSAFQEGPVMPLDYCTVSVTVIPAEKALLTETPAIFLKL